MQRQRRGEIAETPYGFRTSSPFGFAQGEDAALTRLSERVIRSQSMHKPPPGDYTIGLGVIRTVSEVEQREIPDPGSFDSDSLRSG
jgi:hypothetical protein